jgi:uncharacterized membrane protein YsdA (DUF1294 family)/cold shock CspA family protein
MKKEGTIVRWDDARGFGFIRSAASTADVFFHVRDFRGEDPVAPRQGLAVTFEEIHVGGKGPRGMAVQPVGARGAIARPAGAGVQRRQRTAHQAGQATSGSGAIVALPLMLAYAAAVIWGVWVRRLPWWVLAALPMLNLLSFYAYWLDKYAAEKGQWRVKEDTLHLWSLAGGWPGAWFAQQMLRHKSRKIAFRDTYWGTMALHCAALAGWLWWRFE